MNRIDRIQRSSCQSCSSCPRPRLTSAERSRAPAPAATAPAPDIFRLPARAGYYLRQQSRRRSEHRMKVVLIAPVSAEQQAEIAAVDPRIQIEDAWDLFGPELVGDWPRQTTESYLPRRFWTMPDSPELRARRDAVLADAEDR